MYLPVLYIRTYISTYMYECILYIHACVYTMCTCSMYSYPFTCTHVCMYYTYIGMKVLYRTFPKGMLTGVVPKSCLPSPPPTARKGSGKQSVTPKPPSSQHHQVIHSSRFTSEGEICNHVAMVILSHILTCACCHSNTSISPNPIGMLDRYVDR